jgi:phosphotransferase family enzyme
MSPDELGLRVPIGRLDDVLREHHLDRTPEEPFPNDGWSGASMTLLRRGGGDRFVLKRDSAKTGWIPRATADGPVLREAWFAARARIFDGFFSDAIRAPYLGVGRDGDQFGVLMPDLTGVLFAWERSISVADLDRVLAGIAALHAFPWATGNALSSVLGDPDYPNGGPWCPLLERITLISRQALERPGPARDAVGERLLPGWDAFDRRASGAARDLVMMLGEDPRPLLDVLEVQPATLIHGDLKLANVGIAADGVVEVVDWQMVSLAPIAVELGWFLVSNVASLPLQPDDVIGRYRVHLDRGYLDPDDGWLRDQGDVDFDDDGVAAAILVGLLLRGWRKGFDAEAGITLASGVSARDDLAWWCERAVEAADRIL